MDLHGCRTFALVDLDLDALESKASTARTGQDDCVGVIGWDKRGRLASSPAQFSDITSTLCPTVSTTYLPLRHASQPDLLSSGSLVKKHETSTYWSTLARLRSSSFCPFWHRLHLLPSRLETLLSRIGCSGAVARCPAATLALATGTCVSYLSCDRRGRHRCRRLMMKTGDWRGMAARGAEFQAPWSAKKARH